MFVGQIPKEWTESDCHQLLDEFGEIYSIRILRDKKSLMSKGRWCCIQLNVTGHSIFNSSLLILDINHLESK
jgi:C. briggsae CBR-ETR-1 protein